MRTTGGSEFGPSDESAFRQHFRSLVVLAGLLGADDPEDLAQEAFFKLHTAKPLRNQTAVHAFLRTTVVNLVRSRYRHLAVMRKHDRPTEESAADDPQELAASRADNQIVIDALHRLTPRHREALVLRYWLRLTEKEIARHMGVSTGTVKSHVSRGMDALRALLPDDLRNEEWR